MEYHENSTGKILFFILQIRLFSGNIVPRNQYMLKFELKTLEQGMNLFQVNKKHQNHVKNTFTIIPDL